MAAYRAKNTGEHLKHYPSFVPVMTDCGPMCQVNWFAEVFFVTGIPLIIPICYLLDTKGLRPCIIGVAWCNGIGAGEFHDRGTMLKNTISITDQ
jgi:hypothetical protein